MSYTEYSEGVFYRDFQKSPGVGKKKWGSRMGGMSVCLLDGVVRLFVCALHKEAAPFFLWFGKKGAVWGE